MFGVGTPELLFAVMVLVLALVLVVAASRRRAVRPTRESRLVQLTRALGLVTGLVLGVCVINLAPYGRGLLLAPAVFGLCLVLAVAIGETAVRPRREAGVRSASLRVRRAIDYLPRLVTPLVAVTVVLETGLMVFTTLTASADGSSYSHRALACSNGVVSFYDTPYPGSYYTAPLALLLVVLLLVTAVAVRQVVRRPRGLVPDEVGDDALRRRSLDVIVASVGIAVAGPCLGIAATAGSALQSMAARRPPCAEPWMHTAGAVIALSALLPVVVGSMCVVRLLAGSAEHFVRPEPLTATR